MRTIYLLIYACALLSLPACADTDSGENGNGNGTGMTTHQAASPVSMESLLDEMVSYEESVYWPVPAYRSLQTTSTDRRSTAPDKP